MKAGLPTGSTTVLMVSVSTVRVTPPKNSNACAMQFNCVSPSCRCVNSTAKACALGLFFEVTLGRFLIDGPGQTGAGQQLRIRPEDHQRQDCKRWLGNRLIHLRPLCFARPENERRHRQGALDTVPKCR
jgi:hypothetical protein